MLIARRIRLKTISTTAALMVIVLASPLSSVCLGDELILWDTDVVSLASEYDNVYLYDQSQVTVDYNASVEKLYAFNSSTANVYGDKFLGMGIVGDLHASGSSTVNVEDGIVEGELSAYDCSTVDISNAHMAEGGLNSLKTYDSSDVDINGPVNRIDTRGSSIVDITNAGGWHHDSINARDTSVLSVSGGGWNSIGAYNESELTVSGLEMIEGGEMNPLDANGSSTVGILDSQLSIVNANEQSNVSISGSEVNDIFATASSTVDITESVLLDSLSASGSSTVTLHGMNDNFVVGNYRLSDGLSMDGDELLGTGYLSYELQDGSRHVVEIVENSYDSTIHLVPAPEPATMMILGFGSLAIIGRRRI